MNKFINGGRGLKHWEVKLIPRPLVPVGDVHMFL